MPGILNPNSLNGAARTLAAAHPAATAITLGAMLGEMPQWSATPLKTRNYAAHQAMKPAPTLPPPVAPSAPVVPVFRDEVKDGRRTIEVTDSDSIRTLDELLAAADVDLLDWEVERFTVNKWDVTMKGPDALPMVASNWQVKANLIPNTKLTALSIAEIASQLAPLIAKGGYGFKPKQAEGKHYLLELDLFDAHLGKLCDPLESGEEYNLEIAARIFSEAVDALVARAAGFPIERVLLPIGNDFFNSDSLIGATTKGTPQHESSRWQRTFATGCALVTDVVNRLRRKGWAVDVVIVQGNHDFQTAFFLGKVLEAAFTDVAGVTVNNGHKSRKYYQYHDCSLLLAHGDEEKEADLPNLFAVEQPRLWADTLFREIRLGHRHRKLETKYRSATEYKGVVVRYIRSLSATDAWHYRKGFVGSMRGAEAFIWGRGEGVIAQFANVIAG